MSFSSLWSLPTRCVQRAVTERAVGWREAGESRRHSPLQRRELDACELLQWQDIEQKLAAGLVKLGLVQFDGLEVLGGSDNSLKEVEAHTITENPGWQLLCCALLNVLNQTQSSSAMASFCVLLGKCVLGAREREARHTVCDALDVLAKARHDVEENPAQRVHMQAEVEVRLESWRGL